MPVARKTGTVTTALTQQDAVDHSYFVRTDIASPVGTKRWTDRDCLGAGSYTGSIDGSSQTWTEAGLIVGPLDQSDNDTLSVSWLRFWNLDWTWTNWANSPGLRNALVWVYDAWFNTDGSLAGSILIYNGKIDNQELGPEAMLALKPFATPWSKEIPWVTWTNLGASPIMPKPNTVIQWGDALARRV